MKPKNLKEFKALIERYETITLEETRKCVNDHFELNRLTGYGGYPKRCTLCVGAENSCDNCVYGKESCMDGKNEKTYFRIDNADTPTKLKNAYRARAKHMRTLLPC